MKIIYGDGKVHTQQGVTADGLKCLTLTKKEIAIPINATPKEWKKHTPEDEIDVILAFKNIESARTIQDELNELIAVWSREQSPVV